MEKTNSKVRVAAVIATAVALLAIAVPFVWQSSVVAEPAAAVSAAPAVLPVASHASGAGAAEQADAACMADAKKADLSFEIPDLDGKKVKLASFAGKVILLNFWATWCGPCKAEIPGFVELQAQYRDELVVIGFSVDDTAEKAAAFAKEFKINYPVLLGLGYEHVQDAYGPIWGIPVSFLISKDGKICKKHMGIAPKAVFEKEIKALL
ncbi:MAG: TlpA disulfide reductase family protein [Acidobacteriota bacterium]